MADPSPFRPPPRGSLVALALGGEALLAAGGLLWIIWRDLPVILRFDLDGLLMGVAAAALLAGINIVLLRVGPDTWLVRSIRRLYRDLLEPMFGPLGWLDVVVISIAAGVGEELFFRGAVQTEWGLLTASVLFGLVHIGDAHMIAFGVWAASVGAFLGWLALVSGGLVAPMAAHVVYDALALIYIRSSWRGRTWGVASDPGEATDANPTAPRSIEESRE